MADWYENDDFWRTFAPLLADPEFAGEPSQQVDDIIRLLELPPGARVLDLGCGYGRHAIEFAKRGFHVVGVDRTEQYLHDAREKAAAAGLDIDFVQQDMRTFCRPEGFDGAVNLFSTFGYFADPADDHRVAENLCRSLKPGGRLAMQMMGKEVLARDFKTTDWRKTPGGALLLEERKIVGGWESMENRLTFIRGVERKEFTLRLRLYSGVELAALLRQVGFRSIDLYGGLDGIPYDENAKRLVVTARKG